jgi:hypothetical protein
MDISFHGYFLVCKCTATGSGPLYFAGTKIQCPRPRDGWPCTALNQPTIHNCSGLAKNQAVHDTKKTCGSKEKT